METHLYPIVRKNQSYLYPSLIWRMQENPTVIANIPKWLICIYWRKHGQQNNSSPKQQDSHCRNKLSVLILFRWNISWRSHAHHRHTQRKRVGEGWVHFSHFQPLLLYFKPKQAQHLSNNKAILYTQYCAKTW